MLGQARLQVGCFVLVDDVALGKLVKHGAHERQQRTGLLGVSRRTKIADSVSRCLVLVAVAVALLFVRTNALEG